MGHVVGTVSRPGLPPVVVMLSQFGVLSAGVVFRCSIPRNDQAVQHLIALTKLGASRHWLSLEQLAEGLILP